MNWNNNNPCEWFEYTRQNPYEKVDLTVRDYLQMKIHYDLCEKCQKSVDQTFKDHNIPKDINLFGAN